MKYTTIISLLFLLVSCKTSKYSYKGLENEGWEDSYSKCTHQVLRKNVDCETTWYYRKCK